LDNFTRSAYLPGNEMPRKHRHIKVLKMRDIDAQQKAIIERAETNAADIEARAWREGHSKGFAEGRRQGYDELADTIMQMQELLDSMCWQKSELASRHEKDLVGLALEMAEKIVCAELDANSRYIGNIVMQGMRSVADRENLTIQLNPSDLETFQNALKNIKEEIEVGEVTLLGNESIEPGGCIIESPTGGLDGRLGSRMNELSRLGELVERERDG